MLKNKFKITSGSVSALATVIMLLFAMKDRYWPNDSENLSTCLVRRAQNSKSAIELYKNGDYDSAYRFAMKGNLNDKVLQWYLGWMYFEGKGTSANTNETFRLWLESARQGYPLAQNDLALMYERGEGVEVEIDKAIYWYEQAAKQKLPGVAIHLGHIYENPKFGRFNVENAIKWFEYAYRNGDASGARHLGWMCERGRAIPRNMQQAMEWYRKAADAGDINSICRIAMRNLIDKEQTPEDSVRMLEYCATNGSVYARHLLVDLYEFGFNGIIDSDADKAYMYACEFGDTGDLAFQTRAADLCQSGQINDMKLSEAVRRYSLAAKGGEPEAMFKLGRLYSEGRGVSQDYEMALNLYTNAVELWPDYEEANEHLGLAYRNGLGTTKNAQKAIRHFKLAADDDNVTATLNLAEMYEIGDGVSRDLEKALDYYVKLKGIIDEDEISKADSGIGRCLKGLEQQRLMRVVLLLVVVIIGSGWGWYGLAKIVRKRRKIVGLYAE